MPIDAQMLAVFEPAAFDHPAPDGSIYSVTYSARAWYDGDGQLHRDGDLPAVIEDSGAQHWYRHGDLHRGGAPAVVRPRPSRIRYVVERNLMPEPASGGVARSGTLFEPAHAPEQCLEEWWRDGLRHRIDGPAKTWADGVVEYYVDGQRHRDGGLPAVGYPRPYAGFAAGPDEYWVRGRRHCEQGAAQRCFAPRASDIGVDGLHWLEGVEMGRQEWSVLRHYLVDPAVRIDPRNTALRDFLDHGDAIDPAAEAIDADALRVGLAMQPNP